MVINFFIYSIFVQEMIKKKSIYLEKSIEIDVFKQISKVSEFLSFKIHI